jgi:hypothetical protein
MTFKHLVGRNRLRCGLLLFSPLLDPSLRVRLLLSNRNRRGCKHCNGRQDYLHGLASFTERKSPMNATGDGSVPISHGGETSSGWAPIS